MSKLIDWFLGLHGFWQFMLVFWIGIVIDSSMPFKVRIVRLSK